MSYLYVEISDISSHNHFSMYIHNYDIHLKRCKDIMHTNDPFPWQPTGFWQGVFDHTELWQPKGLNMSLLFKFLLHIIQLMLT